MKSSLLKKLEAGRFAATADKRATENVPQIMSIAAWRRLVSGCR